MSTNMDQESQVGREKNQKTEQLLIIFGRGRTRAKEKVRVKMVDKLGGGIGKNDVARRIEMLERLLTFWKDEPLVDELIEQGTKELSVYKSALEKTTSDWVPLYNQIGVATEQLQSSIGTLQDGENQGRKLVDKTDLGEKLISIEKLLGTGTMKASDRAEFQKQYAEDKKLLVEFGNAKGTEREAIAIRLGNNANVLFGRIQNKVRVNDQEAKKLLALHKEYGNKLARVSDNQTDKRVGISMLLREANDLIGLCDYVDAQKKLTEAGLGLDQTELKPLQNPSVLRERVTKLQKSWERYAAGLDQAIKTSQMAESDDVAQLRKRADDLFFKWELNGKAIEFMLSEAGTEAQVGRMLDSAEEDRELAKKVIETAVGLVSGQPPRIPEGLGDVIRGMEQRIQAVKISADDLYKDFQGDAKPEDLLASLESLIGRWAKTRAKAVIEVDLSVDQYTRELDALERTIRTKQNQIEAGSLTQNDIEFERQAVEFSKVFEQLRVSAEVALAADYQECVKKGISSQPAVKKMAADQLVTEQQKARGNNEKVDQRTESMRGLVSEIALLKMEADKIKPVNNILLETRRRQCTDLARQLRGDVTSALTKAQKKVMSSSATKANFSGYADELEKEITLALSPVGSQDMVILNDIYVELVELGKRVADFAKMVKGDKDAPKSFEDIKKIALELQELFKHKRLVPRADAIKDLKDQVDDIVDNFSRLDPRQATVDLSRLKTEIAQAKLRAETEHNELKVQLKLADELVKAVEDQGIKNLGGMVDEKFRKYLENVKFRVGKFKERVSPTDRVDEADKKLLAAIKKEWESAMDVILSNRLLGESPQDRVDKANALKTSMDSVDADEQKIVRARERLNELRDVKLGVLGHIVKGDKLGATEKKNLKKEMALAATAIKQGLANLEKNKDGDAAGTLADSLETRIDRMINSPMGNGTNKRNKIPAVVEQWKQVVALVHERIGKLQQTVAGQCESEEERTAAAKLTPLQTELMNLFVAGAFDSIEKRMTDGSPAPKDVAAAKEDGLREVRRIEAFISKHPKLKLLTEEANPFKEPKLPLAQIGAVLFNLKTNLMVSG